MKKSPVRIFYSTSIFVFLTIFLISSLGFASDKAKAQSDLLQITSIRFAAKDTSFIVYWRTNLEATGVIKYGLTNGFGSSVTDNVLGKYHETTVGGLQSNTTYYFQLTATDANGYSVTSLVYDQVSLDVVPTDAPAVTNISANFVSGNLAQIVWKTPRDATSCVRYGFVMTSLDKSVCDGNMTKFHDVLLKNLARNSQYFYQVVSRDKYNNEQTSTYFTFSTSSVDDGAPSPLEVLEIKVVTKVNGDKLNLDFLSTTNHVAYADFFIGTDKNNLVRYTLYWAWRNTNITWVWRNFDCWGMDCKAFDTDYFYKYEFTDIYGQKLTTPIFKTRTPPAKGVLTIEPINIGQVASPLGDDSDGDGLTNEEEVYYGTDPKKYDTDGDGYGDGVEVAHGFNPIGPGKLSKSLFKSSGQSIHAYGKPRLKDLNLEAAYAESLYRELNKKFKKGLNVTPGEWMYYVKAYVYGDYPISAIYQDIRNKGKTVSPTKLWSEYKNTATYKKYINAK